MVERQVVQAFIEGKVQNRIIDINAKIVAFVEEAASIIENVNASLSVLRTTKFQDLTTNKVSKLYRLDAEGARKSLELYNMTFGFVDHSLAMMSSNFNLSTFLQENGIDPKEIYAYQDEIRKDWEKTYGSIVSKISREKEILDQMRRLLEEQVRLLESIPGLSYFSGFDKSSLLGELFQKERSAFYALVKEVEEDSGLFAEMNALYKTQARKTKEAIAAYLRLMKRYATDDWKGAHDNLERALVILSYSLGALNVCLKMRSSIVRKGVGSLLRRINTMRHAKQVSRQGARIEEVVAELAAGPTNTAINSACHALLHAL